jgi:maltose alpha-D-glucosyltransferase/alpha-amylase
VEGTPAYLGSIDWMTEKDSYVLGMAQPMLENHGDGETFMLERTHNFIERLLAADPIPSIAEISSRALTNPVPHQDLSPVLQVLVGSTAAEFCQALGKQLAALHKALIQADNDPNFGKEAFSLHYQRSLYSGLQTLVRETFEQLDRRSNELPDGLASAKVLLLSRREEILSLLRRVYEQKIDVFKSRIHGHLLLGQVLMTGKGLMIHDFGGRPSTDFGERRLKRSPLRDAITLVRSIYATTYKGFLQNRQVAESSLQTILPYAGQWAQTLSGFFLHAYFEEVKGSGILPENERDRQVLLETFLVRGALLEINDGWQQKERLFAGFKILQSIQPGQ